uniref:Uncharacterized protein n=1 Tax=Chromera velia CCMP2878 TaxID=1169474 RepID=A0A0G4I6K9_9ALVE|eukprot:Cvel_1904.t1-p1 / transcript=Cvel_1904.t1 / gene=Cvel_1904 / organism=Chromera_velia_CCMP2878 / gene_product=hypothetical protein / transcript_product=hypothetical protein / location=Cvel_scaffold71:81544-84510(+) / protein_length=437 / sequence_SO=supercontig / SO=protein_coding / is_pseudo=false
MADRQQLLQQSHRNSLPRKRTERGTVGASGVLVEEPVRDFPSVSPKASPSEKASSSKRGDESEGARSPGSPFGFRISAETGDVEMSLPSLELPQSQSQSLQGSSPLHASSISSPQNSQMNQMETPGPSPVLSLYACMGGMQTLAAEQEQVLLPPSILYQAASASQGLVLNGNWYHFTDKVLLRAECLIDIFFAWKDLLSEHDSLRMQERRRARSVCRQTPGVFANTQTKKKKSGDDEKTKEKGALDLKTGALALALRWREFEIDFLAQAETASQAALHNLRQLGRVARVLDYWAIREPLGSGVQMAGFRSKRLAALESFLLTLREVSAAALKPSKGGVSLQQGSSKHQFEASVVGRAEEKGVSSQDRKVREASRFLLEAHREVLSYVESLSDSLAEVDPELQMNPRLVAVLRKFDKAYKAAARHFPPFNKFTLGDGV